MRVRFQEETMDNTKVCHALLPLKACEETCMQSTFRTQHGSRFFGTKRPFALSALLALSSVLAMPTRAQAQTTITSFEDTSLTQQDVPYRGTDSHIYFRYWNARAGWQVVDATSAAGAPNSASGTSITSYKDTHTNEVHITFEGSNQHLYDLGASALTPTRWTVTDLTSVTGGTNAAVAAGMTSFYDDPNGIRFVFYVGSNQHVDVLYNYNGWKFLDISTAGNAINAAAGSAMTSQKDDFGNLDHVYYQGADLHIHELYTPANPNVIYTTDDTASANGTLTANGTNLASYFDLTNRVEHLYYRGVDTHIHHLFFDTAWHDQDLTSLTGSMIALTNTGITAFKDYASNQQHVFFVGADSRLRQFYSVGNSWYAEDVTTDAGVPAPTLAFPVSSFKDEPDNQQHVFFLGANGHFYHVWYGARWSYEDLTSGGTLPATGVNIPII